MIPSWLLPATLPQLAGTVREVSAAVEFRLARLENDARRAERNSSLETRRANFENRLIASGETRAERRARMERERRARVKRLQLDSA